MISQKKKTSGTVETHDKLPNVRLLWVPIYGLYCARVDIIYFFSYLEVPLKFVIG
jgi:hypothetical protein